MKLYWVVLALLSLCLCSVDVRAQDVKRERPADWNGLVHGGRFMDRFLPMPIDGKLTSDTWGAANVLPRNIDNGIEDREWSYWGGKAILGDDGKYHLFVCRWREDSKKGHHEWWNSIVVHAVSDKSTGPYKVKSTVGPGHNPEVFQLRDGRYVIYVIDKCYVAKSLDGPWTRTKFDFRKRDRGIIEGLTNLTFAQREDGSYLMVCRGGGVWFSRDGLEAYQQVTSRRVYPPVKGHFEDPVVWRTNVQYHLIVNDWLGRIAWYLRSKDGIHWKVDPGEAYLPGIAKYEEGTNVDWYKYERLKVLQDKQGRATQAHFAVIDVLKDDDKGSDNHSSKHICIPLTVGRLMTVLNSEPINADTETIEVKIAAEEGFDPHQDMDLDSLRLGAAEEVNFGRGGKVLKTEKSGADLIVTFDGSGNGITEKNFVAKLLGKTGGGKLLFGYSRLPGVKYGEPVLSARKPRFIPTKTGFDITISVDNFGIATSDPATLAITYKSTQGEVTVATGVVDRLKTFMNTTVQLKCDKLFEPGEEYEFKVILSSPGQRDVLFEFKARPITK